MVVLYAKTCQADLEAHAEAIGHASPRARARALIDLSLHHGTEISDMCRIFRELWAISTRNARIDEVMMAYYAEIGRVLADAILGEAAEQSAKDRLHSLLLPYFEGYSIAAPALPMPMEEVAEILTDIAMELIGPAGERSTRPVEH